MSLDSSEPKEEEYSSKQVENETEPNVGDALKMLGEETKKRVTRKAPKFPRRWTPGEDYELFRKGVILKKHPDQIADKLGPGALFLFRHKKDGAGDDVVSFGEDKDRPLWYGMFKPHDYPDGVYYQPTQDQEKALYRTKPAKTMPDGYHEEDGTPYWVDSYFHKKWREKRNKKRHTSKVNAKKRKRKLLGAGSSIVGTDEQAEIDEEIVISGGLPLDGLMFHHPPDKLRKTLVKNGYMNVRKVAKKSMATATICKDLFKRSRSIIGSMFSSSLEIENVDDNGSERKGSEPKIEPNKKRAKSAYRENMEKGIASDFLSKPFIDPPKLERVPDIIIDYINNQFQMAKGGSRGLVADAMWANFKDYETSSIPTKRVMDNCTGNLLYSFYEFQEKMARDAGYDE